MHRIRAIVLMAFVVIALAIMYVGPAGQSWG